MGNGALQELTKRYETAVAKYGVKEWVPKDFDFTEFEKGLASVQKASTCPGCMKGGGRTDCEMRACASNRKLTGCCECGDFLECEHAELLRKMRDGARDADLIVQDHGVDRETFLARGMRELKAKFPSCLLLCQDLDA